jgi:hypothetical protein
MNLTRLADILAAILILSVPVAADAPFITNGGFEQIDESGAVVGWCIGSA